MNYNFRKDDNEIRKARAYLEKLIKKGSRCKIEETNTRTAQQNRAMWLFCKFMATELNDAGFTHNYDSVLSDTVFKIPFTKDIIMEHYWRPVQEIMFKIKSTKNLNTQKMNDIVDVLVDAMADKGLVVEFPSMETFIKKRNN